MNDDIKVEEIEYTKERGLHMRLQHPMFSRLTEELCSFFADSGAENYLEFGVKSERFGAMNVCIQRAEGKTPAQINMGLKERISALESELDAFKMENTIITEGAKACMSQLDRIRANIHYPDCWDDCAYPTLADAVCEITHCDPEQCQKTKETDHA